MTEEESLLKEFLSESAEHLSRTEADLAALSREGKDADGETVRRIFRAVHTIKGSSGFFGYVRIGSVAHAMESLLDGLRDGRLQPSKEVVETLFEGLDRLSGLFADIEHSNEADTDELERRIRSFVPKRPAKRASPPAAKPKRRPASPPRDGEAPREPEADPQAQPVPRGHHLYRLHFDIGSMERNGDLSPKELVGKLSMYGTVREGGDIDSLGSIGSGGDDLVWRMLYSTVLERDLVAEAAALPVDQVEEIEVAQVRGEPDSDARVDAEAVPVPGPVREPAPLAETDGRNPSPSSGPGAADAATAARAHAGDSDGREIEYLKVRLDILDKLMALAGELVLVRNQQLMITDADNAEARGVTQRLDIVTSDLQETIMRTRMQPIGGLFGRFGRVVRELGRKLGKEIEIESAGNDVELDKNILEALVDPLTHIVRNSCDHGIESPGSRKEAGKPASGRIVLRAFHEGGQINVEVEDDGAGIDRGAVRTKVLEKGLKTEKELHAMEEADLLSLIFLPGFSTSPEVTDISGRGVGMDVVKSNVENLGGVVEIHSLPGRGTCIRLRLPLTLAIIPSMIVETCGQRFAIPQINLEELVTLYDEDVVDRIECAGSREVYRLRDTLLSLVHLQEVLEKASPANEEARREAAERHRRERAARHVEHVSAREAGHPDSWSLSFAVLKVGASRFGLVIDRIVGTEEIVVKPMHRVLKELPVYSGATVLGDGHVALILDVPGIARHSGVQMDEPKACDAKAAEVEREEVRRRLLLVRNRPEEQLAIPLEQVSRIERIGMDVVERIGQREYVSIHGVPTRLLRLDNFLELLPAPELPSMFAVIPKTAAQPYCILVPDLVDSGEYAFETGSGSYRHPAVEGTALLEGKLTMVIRPDVIARIAEPDWFREAA